jgi:hypothetical protein
MVTARFKLAQHDASHMLPLSGVIISQTLHVPQQVCRNCITAALLYVAFQVGCGVQGSADAPAFRTLYSWQLQA